MSAFFSKQSWLRLASLAALAFLFTGCAEESIMAWLADGYKQSTLVIKSTDLGPDIWSLYSTFTWIAAIIFVIVEVLLVYAILRFRAKGDEKGIPEQTHGNTRVEIAWTIAPAIIVLFITIPSIKTIFKLAEAPQDGAEVVRVNVLGKQWWWEYNYPDLGIVTANQLHLPVGKRAVFNVESDDVIHSFWFPNMGGKRDATPGHVNHMYFTPRQPGIYLGQCAEYCGTSHANMKMTLYVQTESEFNAWVAQQKAVPAAVSAPEFEEARGLFMANCAACHAVRGVAEFGRLGPDLTHVASRDTFGSGMYETNDENLSKWLKDPQGMKPGSKMVLPEKLDDATVKTLVDFLQALK